MNLLLSPLLTRHHIHASHNALASHLPARGFMDANTRPIKGLGHKTWVHQAAGVSAISTPEMKSSSDVIFINVIQFLAVMNKELERKNAHSPTWITAEGVVMPLTPMAAQSQRAIYRRRSLN